MTGGVTNGRARFGKVFRMGHGPWGDDAGLVVIQLSQVL